VPFASALSRHPVASEAVGEVAGAVLERLGERPDLALVAVTRHHAGALEDIGATVEAALRPSAVVGCAAEAVVGTATELEDVAGISLIAGRAGPVLELAIEAHRAADGSWRFVGWPLAHDVEPSVLVLLCDPFTFPTVEFLRRLESSHPGMPVLGGQASGGRGPGGTRLLSGRRVTSAGAVGVLVGGGVEVEPVVSQGCRPYGHVLTVTRAEGNVLYTLAGRAALECLVEQSRGALGPDEIARIGANGLYLGRLVDERIVDPGPADFVVRTIVGVDRSSGAVALDDRVPLGSTVRFCLRDAGTAHDDLRHSLHGREADAALAFVCQARGARFFGSEHHDARALERALGPVPVAGFFAAGEIGPVGGRSFLLTNSATLALVRDRPS